MDVLRCVLFFLWLVPFAFPLSAQDPAIIRVAESRVAFTSDAPLEIIKAETRDMAGLINTEKGTFAFSIPMRSFKGFNSPLQMEHFHENYMESNTYGHATFKGRIIEQIDFGENGTTNVRAKGILNIHGQEQERIIPVEMTVSGGEIRIYTEFFVPLSDHDISIPKIVEQKIATEISVKLEATFHLNAAP